MSAPISNIRPQPDKILTDIAHYVAGFRLPVRRSRSERVLSAIISQSFLGLATLFLV